MDDATKEIERLNQAIRTLTLRIDALELEADRLRYRLDELTDRDDSDSEDSRQIRPGVRIK
jgi:predicted  nucleic acid-binding Zn-ribbon protein